MADPVALQGFIDKWLAREPEITLLEVFCPKPQRTLFRTWGALRSELVEVVFELSDSNVARTKLAWWVADLAAAEGGRHPLTRALFAHTQSRATSTAHWHSLLNAAMRVLESDHAPISIDAAAAELLPLAQALGDIEAALFQCQSGATAIARHLQVERSLRGLVGVHPERARLPVECRGAVDAAAIRGYASALLAHSNGTASGSLLTHFHHLLDQQRLRQLASHGEPQRALPIAAWRGLAMAWRAARVTSRSVR